tara:strand:- start:1639 stop:1767 length:129 start_codon:yes stop_codon:yes gene_type:complete
MNRKYKSKKIIKLTRQEIMMIEDEWYDRYNKVFYKQNTTLAR